MDLGYVAGIDQLIADFRCEREAVFERDECGIAMNQHEIEIIANPFDDLGRTSRVVRQNHDVAQRTKDERPGTSRPGGLDQPIEFKAKRSAAKRKRFDQQGIRLLVCKGGQERRPARRSQFVVDRPA